MTDSEPRQLLPETESHQRLSGKLGASRPPPPRSRSRVNPSFRSKQQSSKSAASDHDDGHKNAAEPGSFQSAEASDAPDLAASPELEASGSASPVRMTVQRAVSGTSIRSSRSVGRRFGHPEGGDRKGARGTQPATTSVLALGRAKVQMDEIEARLEEQGARERDAARLHRLAHSAARPGRTRGAVAPLARQAARGPHRRDDDRAGAHRGRVAKGHPSPPPTRSSSLVTTSCSESTNASPTTSPPSRPMAPPSTPPRPVTTHKDLAQGSAHTSQDSSLQDDSVDSAHPGADTDAAGSQSHKTSSRGADTNATTFADERDMATMIEELSHPPKVALVALRNHGHTTGRAQGSARCLTRARCCAALRSASFGRLRAQDGLLDPYDDQDDDDDDDDDDESLDVDDSADDSAAGGSSVASRTIPEEDEDDVDDVPDTPKAPPKPKLKASRRKRADSSAAPLPTADLASELEGSSAQQHPSPGDRAARERRSPSQRFGVRLGQPGRTAEGGARAARGQPGAHPGSGKPDAATKASSAAGADASGQASSLFSFGGASSRSASGASRASAPPKSKRASSIDWRSLPFLGGGGSGSGGAAAGETSSSLRPLTLQSDNLLIPPRDGELLSRGIQPPKHQLVQSPTSPLKQRPQSVSAASGSGGFAAFFSRVVGGASSNALASPGQSDTQSQASTTPGGSLDTGFERAVSSTPAGDAGRREAERTRALQLSEGGSSVTKLSGGPGIASKARQLRAERHQQTLDIAADSAGYPFPSPTNSSAAASRATSGSNSAADSSIWETLDRGRRELYPATSAR
ncbi:hypothetical protein L1887_59698 [Cichorium endivia]|nr:hypothetical protein L1887_59698 [Cichorium endivia]